MIILRCLDILKLFIKIVICLSIKVLKPIAKQKSLWYIYIGNLIRQQVSGCRQKGHPGS